VSTVLVTVAPQFVILGGSGGCTGCGPPSGAGATCPSAIDAVAASAPTAATAPTIVFLRSSRLPAGRSVGSFSVLYARARVGARQRRGSEGGGLDRLSGRQREIAELVALGRTNREIAAELFLSQKTVEGHLSTVFGKLGVTSRAAVAAAIGRAGTDTP
jgi:DNA-binding NarL/FixJ family response regulator